MGFPNDVMSQCARDRRAGITMFTCKLLSTVTLLTVTMASAKSIDDENNPGTRLPRDLIPHHYSIRLLPLIYSDDGLIKGSVRILVSCVRNTDRIILHALDLKIDRKSVKIACQNCKERLQVNRIGTNAEKQFVTIYLKHSKLKKGATYSVSMNFTTYFQEESRPSPGFYRLNYIEDDQPRYLSLTLYSLDLPFIDEVVTYSNKKG